MRWLYFGAGRALPWRSLRRRRKTGPARAVQRGRKTKPQVSPSILGKRLYVYRVQRREISTFYIKIHKFKYLLYKIQFRIRRTDTQTDRQNGYRGQTPLCIRIDPPLYTRTSSVHAPCSSNPHPGDAPRTPDSGPRSNSNSN